MPIYDVECSLCGERDERILTVDGRNDAVCLCGGACRALVSPVVTIGAMPSKPVSLCNGSVQATTNAEVRAYRAETNYREVSTSSSEWKQKAFNLRNEATKQVEKMGYTSIKDFRKNHAERTAKGEVQNAT